MDDLAPWLILHRAPTVGSRTLMALLLRFGSADKILAAKARELRDAGIKDSAIAYLQNPDQALLDADLEWLTQPGNHLITIDQDHYPEILKEIADPPPILYLCGNPDLLHLPQLAIVGSRNPTPVGENTAHALAKHLAQRGLVITSGLADGIDSAAHRGALDGKGQTLAVMGTGVDRIYPARNRTLAHAIVQQGGALISELPLGIPAKPGHFPRRNRIISGLSVGTLVVEAALKSGSLITARLASEQGREVFAIPGSIHNSQARGCHALIRSGAKLVESSGDILEELSSLLGSLAEFGQSEPEVPATHGNNLDESYQKLLEIIGFEAISIDEIVAKTQLKAEEVSSMLLLLELEGHVSSASGGRYYRLK